MGLQYMPESYHKNNKIYPSFGQHGEDTGIVHLNRCHGNNKHTIIASVQSWDKTGFATEEADRVHPVLWMGARMHAHGVRYRNIWWRVRTQNIHQSISTFLHIHFRFVFFFFLCLDLTSLLYLTLCSYEWSWCGIAGVQLAATQRPRVRFPVGAV